MGDREMRHSQHSFCIMQLDRCVHPQRNSSCAYNMTVDSVLGIV
eukprot:COSAG06_NODE_169_length_21469_cov_23.096865_11_plen_44_part_00